ncbi:MAG TPA: tRNA pseudouridine(55) synthase TruB [Gemmatimonadaceae bacterium]|nr:tRNA pseudouridine(55) synthase TruB [Gemmatimonadaceae bacterium]
MTPATTDGLLLVDKPAGLTSHDVVARARRALGQRRVGHAGTLDPFATGLLVLLVGAATRLLAVLEGEPKVYAATVRFGAETTTDDRTGETTRTAAPPERAAVEAAVAALTGEIDQAPPAYSAKRVAGRRAYAAARRGAPLALGPTRVREDRWELLEARAQDLDVRITCGAGTYVRALARDLGRLSASAAHLAALRRLRSGPFDVRDAVALDAVAPAAVRSPLEGLRSLPVDVLDAEALRRVTHGMDVAAHVDGERAALVDGQRELVAIAARALDRWRPTIVLRHA